VCTLSLDRTKLLLLSHNFSNVMINSTSLNEAHYFEYMKMLLSRFPEEILDKYNLGALAVDGWVYI
jgi:hypothetical protein